MKIALFQHERTEPSGYLEQVFSEHNVPFAYVRLYETGEIPRTDATHLVFMGGPMSVNDEGEFPYLKAEKELIKKSVKNRQKVLGICLGAQLIASALGARVFPNACKEIGWFPVRRPKAGPVPDLARLFVDGIEVFHWHGETFELPRGAVRFLESDACGNQAFAIGNRVAGLQFHLETTPESAASLIRNSRNEIVPSATIQTRSEMLARPKRFNRINAVMDSVLGFLSA